MSLSTLLAYAAVTFLVILIAYVMAPKPWEAPQLRIITNITGSYFRVQRRVWYPWGYQWIDTRYFRSVGGDHAFLYMTRELAEEEVAEIIRRYELRHPRNWKND